MQENLKSRVERFTVEHEEAVKEKEYNEMQRKEIAIKINEETVTKGAHSKGLDADKDALA